MRKLIPAITLAAAVIAYATPAHAATATVTVPSPAGVYAPLDITLDGPGVFTINTAALAPTGHWVTSGPCTITHAPGYNAPGPVNGATCSGPGQVHFTTTGQLTSTCPVDGGVFEGLHLTIKLDTAVIYDRQLLPNPVQCWTTPARPAVAVWVAPVWTFTNDQPRPSGATVARVADPAWNYTAHTFTVPAGIVCGRNLVDINPSRWITQLVERGFVCSGVVAASSVATVVVGP